MQGWIVNGHQLDRINAGVSRGRFIAFFKLHQRVIMSEHDVDVLVWNNYISGSSSSVN
jgi:hypothetical protein